MVRLEGLGKMKNSMTSSSLEPVTFRPVEQCLNQLGYRVTQLLQYIECWRKELSVTRKYQNCI
jgi:hypothetical protein